MDVKKTKKGRELVAYESRFRHYKDIVTTSTCFFTGDRLRPPPELQPRPHEGPDRRVPARAQGAPEAGRGVVFHW